MNNNIDLTKILKDCPKGWNFYSSVHGKLYYDGMYVDSSASKIYFRSATSSSITDSIHILIIYMPDGRLYNGEGECTIFPSKDQRDWNKFTAPWYKKEKFNTKTLQPFDKVLCKNGLDVWHCDFFSCYMETWICPNACISGSYMYCIPYNDETKHLVGTKNEVPEYYKYWED